MLVDTTGPMVHVATTATNKNLGQKDNATFDNKMGDSTFFCKQAEDKKKETFWLCGKGTTSK